MPSGQDIRRRIKSVKNIQQITKAMKMVAAARLRRAQERANASKPYIDKIREILTSVATKVPNTAHPLLAMRQVQKTAYVIVAADKGLAGAYTSNVIKEAVTQLQDCPNSGLVTIGRRARDYFKRRAYSVEREYTGFSDKPTYQHAVTIAKELAASYVAGEYDEIYLVFTQFYSPINHKPVTVKLLPVEHPTPVKPSVEEDEFGFADEDVEEEGYIFEPSPAEVLNHLLPKYIETVVYGALLNAAASELGARMTAMGSATDNARDLISKLILNYNKVRQATITREISEIVSGAEALN